MAEDSLNNSFATKLQRIDLDDMDEIVGSQAQWLRTVKRDLNVDNEYNLTGDAFNSSQITKKKLATWTSDARDIMSRQAELISNLQEMIELMKTEALADKAAVIRLQSDLLRSKDAELVSVKNAVQESVQSSVKEGINSYSAAVASKMSSSVPVFTPESLKKVVRTVMVEEDRNRNLLVFGLAEEEPVDQAVSDLFHELEEKPRVEAVSRIGEKSKTTDRPRPVKVTLASATSVSTILTRGRRLKKTTRFKSVYVCPDRSIKERAARKQLIVELKKAMDTQPELYHYIKDGKIYSRDKAAS